VTRSTIATRRQSAASTIFVAALLIGLVGAKNFLPLYGRFNEILLYVMVPWNNVAALVCYVLGILVRVPFIASDVYTGPIARAMGGIDFSWIVGLVAVSAAYYFAVRSRVVVAHAS